MLIKCPHDGTDQDSRICKQKQRSARLQKRRHKPVTNVQCLTCKPRDFIEHKPEKMQENRYTYCKKCGSKFISYRKTHVLCDKCSHSAVKRNAKCSICGKKFPRLYLTTNYCITCLYKLRVDTYNKNKKNGVFRICSCGKKFIPSIARQRKCPDCKDSFGELKREYESQKRICENCGADISHRHGLTKLCRECAHEAHKKRQLKWARNMRLKNRHV